MSATSTPAVRGTEPAAVGSPTRTPLLAALVTHDMEEAVVLADRILVMEAGQLTFETVIDLKRPRARSCFAFIELKERVLAQVMQSREAPLSHVKPIGGS